MPQYVVSDLGLHCLPSTLLWVPGKDRLKQENAPYKQIIFTKISSHFWKRKQTGSSKKLFLIVKKIGEKHGGVPIQLEKLEVKYYRKNSKYWDMYVGANSLDSDQTALKEQSDQDLHCLPFFLHLLETLLHCKIKWFILRTTTVAGLGVPIFRVFTVGFMLIQTYQNLKIILKSI